MMRAGGRTILARGVLIACATALVLASVFAAFAAEAPADRIVVQRVDTTKWPTVRLRVVLPGQMLGGDALGTSDFELTENGAGARDLKAVPVAASSRALDVLLVVDISGSMEGEPLARAKAAAIGFVDQIGTKDRVGLIAFGGKPQLIAPFSTDRAAIRSRIESLTNQHQTALYDALALASTSFEKTSTSDKAILLLSDGDDSDSGYSLSGVIDTVQEAGIPVYAVRLGDQKAGASALQAITNASGGRLIAVSQANQLADTFSGIARQITSPYDVTYTSLRPPSTQLDLMLTASSGRGRASIALAVPNPDGVQAGPVETPAPLPSRLWPLLIAALVFFSGAALAGAAMLLSRPEPNAIAQLKYFEQMRESRGRAAHDLDPESVRGRVVQLAGTVAAKGGFDSAIRQALERAGLPLRSVEYMVMHSSAVLVVGVLVELLTRNLIVTGLVVVFMALGPIVLLSVLADRRSAAFQEQLPDVLNLLASSLRAGWGLQQAVGVVVSELGPPAAPEFERVVTESRLGIPLEDALEKMAVRMESEDFKWAVTAIAIQREVGGNLSEVLDMVAATIRERAMLRRQISSLTAEGRLSAIILIALPFLEGTVLWMMNPGYFAPLFGSPYGIVTALFGVMLLAVGIVWLRSVVKIEV